MAQQITAMFPNEVPETVADRLRSEGFLDVQQFSTQNGKRAIIVGAPFGSAMRLIDILTSSGAEEIREESARPKPRGGQFTEATGMNGPERDRSASLVPSSADESFYVSSLIGLPLLFDNPAPLSSLLGLPTLILD